VGGGHCLVVGLGERRREEVVLKLELEMARISYGDFGARESRESKCCDYLRNVNARVSKFKI
jgi:hypothetical protein